MPRPEPIYQPTMVTSSVWDDVIEETEQNSREGWAVRQIIPFGSNGDDIFIVYEWIGEPW